MTKKLIVKKRKRSKQEAEPRIIGGSDRDFWGDIDSPRDDEWARLINLSIKGVNDDTSANTSN